METNVNYTIVGIFVIALVAAIILAIVWLSSGFAIEQYSTYMLYMQESVTGLNIDSAVEFNGVNVGTVKSIELNHKNPQLVELLLNIKSGTPITRGTYATLATRGVTGNTYIALKDKSTDLRPLVVEAGQSYPVIPSAPSLFMRLDTALSRLSKNFDRISQAIQSLLDKDNQESIKETLKNIRKITGTLADNSQRMTTILQNTANASAQLAPLLQSSTGSMRVLEAQTLPATYRLLGNLDSVVRTLSEVASQLKQNPSILIRGAAPPPPGPGETK